MSSTPSFPTDPRRRLLLARTLFACATLPNLVACERAVGSAAQKSSSAALASHAGQTATDAPARGEGWPRTIDTAKGALTLSRPPRRIVSTSVTLTGTLLTIEAPLVATAATQAGSTVSDGQGFFTQWADVARSRGVQVLYQGEPDAEAIAASEPDLIVVSATGGDSALKLHEQLSQIAPTLVLNYDDRSWQELATVLGRATGQEAQARAAIERFATHLAATRNGLRLPMQPTTAMVYYEDGSGANIWTPDSAQGRLLTELGFTLAQVPVAARGDVSMGVRKDIIQVSGEHFATALQGKTLLLFSADDHQVSEVRANKFLSQVPAVAQGRVHAMGLDTFRLDHYSASNLLDRLARQFS